MRLPAIEGVIDRRVLVNYRLDPDVAARLLPAPFVPKLVNGLAMAGICLIRLKNIRPVGMPPWIGIGSENAAHRFAVQWDHEGQRGEGVFIPRRDSSSRLNCILGGRLVPGKHHHACFNVNETAQRLHIEFTSDDGDARVKIQAQVTDDLTAGSVFGSLNEASHFFEGGALGYSVAGNPNQFDALELQCKTWSVEPLAVEVLQSSFFDDRSKFPAGSATLDCALLMRGIEHQWHSREAICCAVDV